MNDDQLLALTDICVKCGLCLPACPTFRLTANESESPRGRIAQIQGLLSGALPDTADNYRYLDHCLLCRSCESVCPSKVPYARILDQVRRHQTEMLSIQRRWLTASLLGLAANPAAIATGLRTLARPLARTYARKLGVLKPLGLERAEWLLPGNVPRDRLEPHYQERGGLAGRVSLHGGCVGRYFSQTALRAAVDLLTGLGFAVDIPAQPDCCGAIHRHAGFTQEADRLLDASAQRHGDSNYRAIIFLASACGTELREHPAMAERAVEICRFLADYPWPATWQPTGIRRRVAVHLPCSHRHGLGDSQSATDLLSRIPALDLFELPDNDICCGAAGLYTLTQPELSQRLLDAKLAVLAEWRPDILVTTNVGCALQLGAGLRTSEKKIRICHPVELLAEALAPAFG